MLCRLEVGLAQFYQHFCSKALILVNPTVLEIFYRHFCAKALVLVNPTVLEIFYEDFWTLNFDREAFDSVEPLYGFSKMEEIFSEYCPDVPICPQTKKNYHEIHLKFYSVYLGYITLVPTQLNNLRDEPMSLRYCEKWVVWISPDIPNTCFNSSSRLWKYKSRALLCLWKRGWLFFPQLVSSSVAKISCDAKPSLAQYSLLYIMEAQVSLN